MDKEELEELLRWYINWVGECEGVDFIYGPTYKFYRPDHPHAEKFAVLEKIRDGQV